MVGQVVCFDGKNGASFLLCALLLVGVYVVSGWFWTPCHWSCPDKCLRSSWVYDDKCSLWNDVECNANACTGFDVLGKIEIIALETILGLAAVFFGVHTFSLGRVCK